MLELLMGDAVTEGVGQFSVFPLVLFDAARQEQRMVL
jgi:hypothetical protein